MKASDTWNVTSVVVEDPQATFHYLGALFVNATYCTSHYLYICFHNAAPVIWNLLLSWLHSASIGRIDNSAMDWKRISYDNLQAYTWSSENFSFKSVFTYLLTYLLLQCDLLLNKELEVCERDWKEEAAELADSANKLRQQNANLQTLLTEHCDSCYTVPGNYHPV